MQDNRLLAKTYQELEDTLDTNSQLDGAIAA